ncbi:general stress protein [Boudabousia marimammalium]|uniref:General stress protein 17M-like domain-containing protein n=1 Tax=Boudabousia marimammalium TaxID=156892 RepID=A0A1Q5PM18_9ACTO|nr:general stress protein [Boudabousia marimammalium]OKL48108.1 hypothetical protein BM477_06530 [Boudabousia marimammalium]
MSNSIKTGGATLPSGTAVARYEKYEQAQAAVDQLSEAEFPVQHVAIVGVDLKLVEHVMGRITFGKVLLAGAAQGLWLGFMVGLIAGVVGSGVTTASFAVTLSLASALGLVGGILFGILSYFMRRDKRDYLSHSHVVAASYEVIAAENAELARKTLENSPGNLLRREISRPRAGGDDPSKRPPRYGVRLTEAQKQAFNAEAEGVSADTPAQAETSAPEPVAEQKAPAAPTVPESGTAQVAAESGAEPVTQTPVRLEETSPVATERPNYEAISTRTSPKGVPIPSRRVLHLQEEQSHATEETAPGVGAEAGPGEVETQNGEEEMPPQMRWHSPYEN